MSNVNKISTTIKKFDFKTISNFTTNSSQQKQPLIETVDILELGKGPINIESYSAIVNVVENTVKVDDLREILKTGDKSNQEVIDLLCSAIQEELDKGNMEAYNFLNAIIKTKKEHPDMKFDITDVYTSYYNHDTKTVTIGKEFLNSHSVIFHEAGHMLHFLNTNIECPDDFDKMKKTVRKNSENTNYWQFMDYFSQQYNYYLQFETSNFWREVYRVFGMNIMQYEDYLTNAYQKQLGSSYDREYARELALNDINSKIYSKVNTNMRDSGNVAMMDIMDAIYDGDLLGNRKDSKGNAFYMYGHGENYYDGIISNIQSFFGTEAYDSAYAELIANYTDLRVSGNTQALNSIKYMLGDDLYNEVEKTYEKALGI